MNENKHIGSSFDDFLKEEEILDHCENVANLRLMKWISLADASPPNFTYVLISNGIGIAIAFYCENEWYSSCCIDKPAEYFNFVDDLHEIQKIKPSSIICWTHLPRLPR
jgi:hypothetical protein